MIDHKQLRQYVIEPVLDILHPEIPFSVAACDLLMGTAIQESDCGHWLHQITGPALGIWQMEPATYLDHAKWLDTRHALRDRVFSWNIPTRDYDQLIGNLYFACAMARVHYWRVPVAMPQTIEGQAVYWKSFYNTPAGAGTVMQYLQGWKRVTG